MEAKMSKKLVLLLGILMLLALPLAVSAQTTGGQASGRCQDAPPVDQVGGLGSVGQFVSAYVLCGFDTYTVNTQDAFGVACADVTVYKVSPQKVQDLWNVNGNVWCVGDVLYINAGGTGHYILYTGTGRVARFVVPGGA
jgi:hypothetical protein